MRALKIPEHPEPHQDHERFGMIGRSPVMEELYQRIARVAGTDCPVLIEGETGTGKDLVARALHRQSRRRDGPFVAFNVATLPEQLFESELFGHCRGAFSGAHADHPGLAEAADGGTLFFDEIGEMPVANQAKLLRFLDTREVRRVGGIRPRRVDLRILCATNRDLRSAVDEGSLRADLFYRLRVISVRVPSLRRRREDLPLLVAHFTGELARRDGRRIAAVAGEAMERILGYDWPGNVRELHHELAQAVALTPDGGTIAPEVLSSHVRPTLRPSPPTQQPPRGNGLDEIRRAAERDVVLEAVERYGWNVSAAARALRVNRVSLTRKLRSLGIRRPGRPEAAPGSQAAGRRSRVEPHCSKL